MSQYTALMGIKKDLHFAPADFSNIASAYAVAHLLMQIPNTYFLQRFPASKWLCLCIMAWGVVTLATAAVKDAPGMMTARIFLAITEATIGRSLIGSVDVFTHTYRPFSNVDYRTMVHEIGTGATLRFLAFCTRRRSNLWWLAFVYIPACPEELSNSQLEAHVRFSRSGHPYHRLPVFLVSP